MSVNEVTLLGNLGKDPELRYTPSGAAVATFSLATTEKFKDRDGQKQEKTEWHNIVVWNQLAEICSKYLHKGSQIYAKGKIQTRSYDDRDGNKRYITEINVNNMQMLNNCGDRNQPQDNPYQPPQETRQQKQDNYAQHQPAFTDDDEIPF